MVNVILYTRVSTDEQADGMSLEAQERYLRAYCTNHGYNIVGDEQPYKEDYSAKSHELDRPELMKVYKYCKKHRGRSIKCCSYAGTGLRGMWNLPILTNGSFMTKWELKSMR